MRMIKKSIVITTVAIIIIAISFIYYIKADGNSQERRTYEEYIEIFIDNKEDFEYVAEIMLKYPSEFINFYGLASTAEIKINDQFLCSNREIAIEILSDEEFYNHLMNLYNLDEISYIINEPSSRPSESDTIFFYFSKFPKDYHGGIVYKTNVINRAWSGRYEIDENWALYMLPNI